MALLTSDDFDVGADTLIQNRVPTVGTGWTFEIAGTPVHCAVGSDTVRIVSATNILNAGAAFTCQPDPTNAEYDVQASISFMGTTASFPMWLVARFTDASNYYVAGVFPPAAAADAKIVKNVAATKTELASGDTGPVAGDVYKFEVRNGTKTLFKNSVSLLSTADNALTSAGKAGLGFGNLGTSAGDDMTGNNRWDNFSVVEVDAGVTGTVAATVAVTSAIAGSPGFQGTVAATVAVAPAIAGTPIISGTVAAAASVTSAIAGSPGFKGTVVAAATVTPAIAGTPVVQGTVAATAAVAAEAFGGPVGIVAGFVAAQCGVAAAAAGTPVIVGSATTAAGIAALVQGAPIVAGTTASSVGVVSSAIGAQVRTGTVAGNVTLTSLAQGRPVIVGSVGSAVGIVCAAEGFAGEEGLPVGLMQQQPFIMSMGRMM